MKAFRLIPARAGNTSFALSLSSAAAGSSPLARGTRAWCRRRCRVVRLIPARAGNTWAGLTSCADHAAHPRSRGEHVASLVLGISTLGSSPLARGTPPLRLLLFRPRRLIPARAGNTPAHISPSGHQPAHPRSRGEHELIGTSVRGQNGSSPLARGTRFHRVRSFRVARLIPARAGNTRFPVVPLFPLQAHPRSRGEH